MRGSLKEVFVKTLNCKERGDAGKKGNAYRFRVLIRMYSKEFSTPNPTVLSWVVTWLTPACPIIIRRPRGTVLPGSDLNVKVGPQTNKGSSLERELITRRWNSEENKGLQAALGAQTF